MMIEEIEIEHFEIVLLENESMQWSSIQSWWSFLCSRCFWSQLSSVFAVECLMITFCSYTSLIWFDQRFDCCYIRCSRSRFSKSLWDICEDCRDQFNNRANSSNLIMIFKSIRSVDWNAFRWNVQNLLVLKFTDRNSRCSVTCTDWDDRRHTYWEFSCLLCQDLNHCRTAFQNRVNLSLEAMKRDLKRSKDLNFSWDLFQWWEYETTLLSTMMMRWSDLN
jgi:hypothetical protein